MLMRPLALAVVLAAFAGCSDHETGPSLSFVVESQGLAASSTVPNASAVCCCRVRGTVRNTSSIPVHLNLNFDGRSASGASLGTAMDFVANLPPGERASFEAVGIIAPCDQVATLVGRHNVTGLNTGAGAVH
jgi:hypothetical protein